MYEKIDNLATWKEHIHIYIYIYSLGICRNFVQIVEMFVDGCYISNQF